MMFAAMAIGFVVGLLIRRKPNVVEPAIQVLNRHILFVALPALILLRVPDLVLDQSAAVPVALAWTVILTSAAAVYLLARRAGWSREVTGALLLVVPLSNSAFVGVPVVDAIFDGAATSYAVLYDQLGNFMGLAIYAAIVVAVWGDANEKPSAGSIARRIFVFPPFVVLLVALVLPSNALPGAVETVFELLALTIAPCALVIVGMQLDMAVPAHLRRPLISGLAIKLALAPLLVMASSLLLGLGGAPVQASLIQAAMPPMITAGLVGIAGGLSRPLIAATVAFGTLCSVVTVPVVAWLAFRLT